MKGILSPAEKHGHYDNAAQFDSKREARNAANRAKRALKKQLANPNNYKFDFQISEGNYFKYYVRVYAQNLTAPKDSLLSHMAFIGWLEDENVDGGISDITDRLKENLQRLASKEAERQWRLLERI